MWHLAVPQVDEFFLALPVAQVTPISISRENLFSPDRRYKRIALPSAAAILGHPPVFNGRWVRLLPQCLAFRRTSRIAK
jgi:hypothetical protein